MGNNPKDPRIRLSRHAERGPVRYPRGDRPGWTRHMVAEAAKVSLGTLKRDIDKGLLDLSDFAWVVDYIVAKRLAKSG